jgi:Flp pilus assembly protein TadD
VVSGSFFNAGGNRRAIRAWLVAAPLLAVALVYHEVPFHDFVNFDDPMFLYENGHVARGFTWEGFVWAWTNKDAVLWHPLAWIGHMAVAETAGMNPAAHLLVNLGLHAANACLLGVLLYRLTGMPWRSLAVAVLFALHPVNVEVAAWASQLKTTSSAFFFLLGVFAYVRGIERGRESGWIVLLLFAVSMLAKPALVFFPAVLVLLDFWPLRRIPARGDGPGWRRWTAGKLPFMILAAVLLSLTMLPWTTAAAADVAPMQLPDWRRLGAVPGNYAGFLKLFVWPLDLAVLYPESHDMNPFAVLGAAGLLAAVTVWIWVSRTRRPELLTGWLWFVVLLLPASGVLRAGQHTLADRYLYVPSIGLMIAVVWSISGWLKPRARGLSWFAWVGCAVPLGLLAERQTSYWADSTSLWRRAAAVTPPNEVRHINLGNALLAVGAEREAEAEFRAAIRLEAENPRPYVNLAILEQRRGRTLEAVQLFRQARALAPTDARILSNLGSLLDDLGQQAEARLLLEQATRLNPLLPEAWVNLGVLHAKSGDLGSARGSFEAALRLRPDHPEALRNMGVLLRQMAPQPAPATPRGP